MDDPDMGVWTYEYDAVGNLIRQTDAKAEVLSFEYDAINRLTKKINSTNSSNSITLVTYTYDAGSHGIGRLSKITDLSGSTEFFYDKLGREIKSIKDVSGVKYQVSREYDVLDRLTKLTYSHLILTYSE